VIVKIHGRGAGGGSGPVDYLLGPDRQREQATVLRGNPEHVKELIDGCEFARTYTSGVLSFQESDLPEGEKQRLMDEWEQTLMTGLDKDQYACLWVQHQDKGRLELNFVIPNIELQSGKRLQPYFDRADRPRVNAWQTLTNDRLGLRDPNDPANRRALTPSNDLPRNKQQAAEAITKGLISLIEQGEITDRKGVISHLTDAGLSVVRETKSSISIADPAGGPNIRLKGVLYERDFKFSAGVREQIEAASQDYRNERRERIREARETYHRGLEIKLREHTDRYPRRERQPAKTDTPLSRNDMAVQPGIKWDPVCDIDWSSLVSRDYRGRTPERNQRAEPDPAGLKEPDRSRRIDNSRFQEQERVLPDPSAGGEEDRRVQERSTSSGHQVQRQITSSDATESILGGFIYQGEEIHDRNGAAASERIRELTEALRTTAASVAGQLRQLTAHVRGYLAGVGEKRQGLSGLEHASHRLGAASRELKQNSAPLEQLAKRHEQRYSRGHGMSL